jgi:hypothetical protein
MSVLAHCGSNWIYCDGGSVAAGLLFLLLVRWSVKRAERHARQRAADRAVARALDDLAAKHEERTLS